jgi:hypothetical protein
MQKWIGLHFKAIFSQAHLVTLPTAIELQLSFHGVSY